MWRRVVREGEDSDATASHASPRVPESRRAYYRVAGWIRIRIMPLARDAIAAAVQDLSTVELQRIAPLALESEENRALVVRLIRIEEKLDRLLGGIPVDAMRPLSGRDRRFVVFSGAGLALDVDFRFRRGDAFRVELLLPAPHSRSVRAVAEAVEDSQPASGESRRSRLALCFRHIETDERNGLIAYSYDLQRHALRAKHEGAAARP